MRLRRIDRTVRVSYAQRGAALLIMLAIIATGASWMMVSALNTASNRTTLNRQDAAKRLAEAKHALVGWVVRQAIQAGEDNPGRLPCPEAAAFIGTANEGIAAGNCTLPAVGRLPWRTLGMPKLLDPAGEPLWYIVSPGWALPTATSTLSINSDSLGQLTLDGAANTTVALIVAPGPALNVQASAGCAARAQARNALAPDYRDYLECENAASPADTSFATRGPTASFNDQVLAVTTRDLLPGLEGAIAKRIEREIVPQLQSVYAGAFNVPAANPVFPYAATFANPGTDTYQGVAFATQGLLPFNQVTGCNPATDPRCLTSLIAWWTTPVAYDAGGWGYIQYQTCYWESADVRVCDGEYHEDTALPWQPGMIIGMQATFGNVAMGLRALDATKIQVYARDNSPDPWITITTNASVALNANGSATVTVSGQLPNIDTMVWGTWAQYKIRLERQIIGDHPLLDPTDPTTGWFVRNEWYRLLFYGFAPGHAAIAPTPRACEDTTPTCLSVANVAPADKQRALLLLAGRSLVSATRPNAIGTDYIDSAENLDGDATFEQLKVGANANDRIIVVDANP